METDEQFEADLEFLLQKPTNKKQSKTPKVPQDSLLRKEAKKPAKKSFKLSMAEITKDMDGISFSSDENDEPKTPGNSSGRSEKEDFVEHSDQKLKKKRKRSKKKKGANDNATEGEPKPKEILSSETETSEKLALKEKSGPEFKPKPASTKSLSPLPSPAPGSPHKHTAQSSRAVARAPQKSFLTAMEPTKAIFGLSNAQIVSLPLNDVKLKLLVSSGSKHIQNTLGFVRRESNQLFEDYEKKRLLFQLCIDVALMESIGFKRVAKKHPQVEEWFGDIKELNLENTKTNVTQSNKDVHKNSFDYSMLSLLGHILIWGMYLQRKAKQPVFTRLYNISVPNIQECLGGDFLWDRLAQHQKMNAKRWKHVIKFRQTFPFEVNQFMMVLRFMKVDDFSACGDIDRV